jgi:hypothetical protein
MFRSLDLENISMRPIAQLEHDLSLRGHFKSKTPEELYAQAYMIDGTAQVLLELVISGQPMTNEDYNHAIVPTYGPTGSGKSTLVQKELSFLRRVIYKENHEMILKRAKDQRVHSTWSPLQTISRLRYGEVLDLDSFYQDEHRKGRVGQGSATNDWLLQQAEETLRANGNSFFFCSPSPREHIPHWIQETIGFNKNTGYNSCYILGPRYHKPICVAHFGPGFTIDPVIKNDYVASKKAYNASVKKGGGWVTEIDPEIEQYAYDELKKELQPGVTRAEVEHIYNELGLFPGYYMNRVISRVMADLKRTEREHKELLRKQRLEELARIDAEQKELFEDVAESILQFYRSLGIEKRPVLGAIKHNARKRGINKSHMGEFTDYFLHRWTIYEAGRPKPKKAEVTVDELVERGHIAEEKGKVEEVRWQEKFIVDETGVLSVKPNDGKRAPPGKPDLTIWTRDRGLWLLAIKYRQDYHNAWVPYFLKSGADKPCPEFRIARTIIGGAEAAGCKLKIINTKDVFAVKIDKNGIKKNWIPSYVVVPFCGQIAENEFWQTVNFLNPPTRGLQLENIDEFQDLDTPATFYIESTLERISAA